MLQAVHGLNFIRRYLPYVVIIQVQFGVNLAEGLESNISLVFSYSKFCFARI